MEILNLFIFIFQPGQILSLGLDSINLLIPVVYSNNILGMGVVALGIVEVYSRWESSHLYLIILLMIRLESDPE